MMTQNSNWGNTHNWRLDLARNVMNGAIPTQKDWFQIGEGAREARRADERELLERAYRKCEQILGIVGAGEA